MDYYQELGLKPAATVEEIRQAYKLLARLVHPDAQTDPTLRAMADRQMQRLNEILATLTDGRKRHEYDSSLLVLGPPLRRVPAPPAPALLVDDWRTRLPEWAQLAVQYWFWLALALALLCVGLWYMAQDKSGTDVAVSRTTAAPSATPPAASSAATPQPPQSALSATADAPPAAVPLHSDSPAPSLASATPDIREAPPSISPPPPVTPAPFAAEPAVIREIAPEPSFAGNWFHVPETSDALQPGSYRAIYVELLLGLQHDELSGSYRARYHIPDIAISPDVTFRVQGKAPAGHTAKLTWTAPDGAAGEVEMSLHGPNRMHIAWWTTHQGRRAALASGTANLIRQQTPASTQ